MLLINRLLFFSSFLFFFSNSPIFSAESLPPLTKSETNSFIENCGNEIFSVLKNKEPKAFRFRFVWDYDDGKTPWYESVSIIKLESSIGKTIDLVNKMIDKI